MTSRRTFALAAGPVLTLLLGLPLNAADLVSINASGTAAGNDASFGADLSADGRFVAFMSNATDLIPGDTPGLAKIFVRDLLAGTTVLASFNVPPHIGVASTPRLSADGRFMAYTRETCAFPTFCPTRDVFVRDLVQGTTTLVSVAMDGTPATGFGHAISPDGRYVAFFSLAGNLVPNDSNGFTDVFVRDLVNETTQLVSVNMAGTGSGNAASGDPAFRLFFSGDGQFLAFTSAASDLVANDGNGTSDAFLRDLVNGTTRLVSVNAAGTQSGNDFSTAQGISADGRRVVFLSSANDLVPIPDTNTSPDVFVRDFGTGSTQLVSVNSTGTGSGSFTSGPSFITSNGRFVVFSSMANNLVPEDTNARTDVFLRDLEAGVTRLASGGDQGSGGDDSQISGQRVVSEDGRFVTFVSSDTTLVTSVTYPCPYTPCEQTFLRDFQSGVIRLLSITPAGDMAGDRDDLLSGVFDYVQISQDGRVVTFQTGATNLATVPDTNESSDIFVDGAPEGLSAAEVPALGGTGLALLALLVAVCGALSLRRL